MVRLTTALATAALVSVTVAARRPLPAQSPAVALRRIPEGGLQPQVAATAGGTIHLVYFLGEPRRGDLFYTRTRDGGATFSRPVRVNTAQGSAIATGTIRGAQLAVGSGGGVHVIWNASDGTAVFYTRINEAGTAFEPQRNLIRRTGGVDGGGAVAADAAGHVYVAWHASEKDAAPGEAGRRVWVARSEDDGRTFAVEGPAWDEPTGACGCCGMGLSADRRGNVYALYRSGRELVHRDVYLLASADTGRSYRGTLMSPWETSSCPMSSMAFAEGPSGVIAAWESAGDVRFTHVAADGPSFSPAISPPGEARSRKHPRVAVNSAGQVFLVWTEGTAWARGGSLAWRVFAPDGRALAEQGGRADLPAWSFGAAAAQADGTFAVFY
ncbi:MAG: hypothetical protein DMF80_05510 [Acidobacteria bacterium]|nr:MAG: hypothetical protein DMF80_05510 [Acidobacteriota bacterium]